VSTNRVGRRDRPVLRRHPIAELESRIYELGPASLELKGGAVPEETEHEGEFSKWIHDRLRHNDGL